MRRGCITLPPRDHAVFRFEKTIAAHPEVWNNAAHREMTIGALLSMGTNMILKGVDKDNWYQKANIAGIIQALDCYDGKGDYKYAYSASNMKGIGRIQWASANEKC